MVRVQRQIYESLSLLKGGWKKKWGESAENCHAVNKDGKMFVSIFKEEKMTFFHFHLTACAPH